MGTEITETEHVAGHLRRVSLGGVKVRVPLTPTLSYMFWMRGFLKRFNEQELTDDDLVDCYEQTVTFLKRYNPTLDEQAIQDNCELADLIGFYSRAFSGQDEEDADEGEARPPRSKPRGGASSSRRTAPKSRS